MTTDAQFDPPHTPSTGSDEPLPRKNVAGEPSDVESDDEEVAEEEGPAPRRKPGGYDSRIEQLLYENPKMPILIIEAGKSTETGGRYIVYTIKTGVSRHKIFSSASADSVLKGARCSPTILGVLLSTRCSNTTSSHSHHSSNTRKAHNGRLRRKPNKRETRSTNNRPQEAYARRVS
jgi:hypothetical protein